MNKCSICNNKAGIGSKKINQGYVCKECLSKTPKFIQKDLPDNIKPLFTHLNKDIKFKPTGNYGNLYLDEMNGMFAIKEGSAYYPFYLLDITNVSVYCTNPHADRYDKVTCDIEFNCEIQSLGLKFKTKIKQKAICPHKRTDNQHIEFSEPTALSMFRSMFNQAIKNEAERYTTIYNKNIADKNAIEKFKAKALFILGNEYDYETLEKQYNRTISSYDKNNPDDKIYIDYINEAYILLANEL